MLYNSPLGLRLSQQISVRASPSKSTITFLVNQQRCLSSRLIANGARRPLAKDPEASASSSSSSTTAPTTSSSFFTPSLCRTTKRHASSTSTAPATSPESVAAQVLDWNTFFRLRTSRRRYSLASSILSAIGSTGGMFVLLTSQPELADEMTKLIPADPFVSMGIATFGATLLGWLIGPIFGSMIWRVFHRTRLAEFTIKERAFFERIRKHRVNPTGASTNNPVPDYYGEKIGSVAGYRRWLKDQRAFNRKREGIYSPAT